MRPGKPGATHQVVFYSKPGCCLCDDARDLLDDLAGEFTLDIEEINILTDPSLYDRYKNEIPLIVVDGSFTVGGRIRREDLSDFLGNDESGR